MKSEFENIWDVLVDSPDEAAYLKKRSDYLILISARLNGQSGNEADKAKRFGVPVEQVRYLMKGKIVKFNLSELMACISQRDFATC